MNTASRIKLARELLRCAKMVLDADCLIAAKQKTPEQKILLQKMRFIWDKFHNPSQTSGCHYTDLKYQYNLEKKNDWHHLTGTFNAGPSSTIRRNIKIIDNIIDKITNNSYSINDIHNKKIFSQKQCKLIDELYSLEELDPLQHMGKHKTINDKKLSDFAWESTIISSLSFPNVRDFFQVIKQALISYDIPKTDITHIKEKIVNFLLEIRPERSN